MGRTVIAEDGLEFYIKALIEQEKFKVGLIFGQEVNAQKAYVIHLSRTPESAEEEETENNEENTENKSKKSKTKKPEKGIGTFDERLVNDHARQVVRSLSGGITILGLFIISPEDVFQSPTAVTKLRKILTSVDQTINTPSITVRQPFSAEKIILHISSSSEKYTCKTFDILSNVASPKPADWKFQMAAGSPWIELNCNLNINFSVGFSAEQASMRAHVETALGFFNKAVKKSLCLIDGVLRPEDEPLDFVEKEKSGRKKQKQITDEERQKSMMVELLMPEVLRDGEKQTCLEEISFRGQLCVKAFVHGKATVAEAIEVVHEDIVRSLWARCDMHCDSLIGEEQRGEPDVRPVLHEPPRRVFAPLPFSPLPASDYLFPGEGPKDSLLSLAELLDLGSLLEGDIQDYWEAVAETSEIFDNEEPPAVKTEQPVQASDGNSPQSLFILIAAVIGLMAIIIAYLYI